MQSDPFVLNFLYKTQVLGSVNVGGKLPSAAVLATKAATEPGNYLKLKAAFSIIEALLVFYFAFCLSTG